MQEVIKKYWPYLIIAVTGVLLYSGITKTYAFTDAYEFVYSAKKLDFINVFLAGGRPIYGLIMKWSYVHYDSIEVLSTLRVFALLLSVISACYLFYYLRSEGYKKYDSLFIAALLLTSPSLSIKVVWSVLWLMPFVVLLSFISGALFVKYHRKGRLRYLITAILLGLMVLLTYQPLYTFSLLPIFLNWLKEKDFKSFLKVGTIHLLVYIVYFLVFKTYLLVFDITALDRASLSINILERIEWFFTEPFTKLFIWNMFFVPNGVQWVLRSFIIFSALLIFFQWLKKDLKHGASNILIVFLFVVGSFIPNILSSDDWVAYRTMDALVFLPIIFIWHAILTSITHDYTRYFIYGSFFFVSIAMAYQNINNGFIDLQVAELVGVKKKISASIDMKKWHVVPAPLKTVKEHKILKKVVSDEFGRLSSSSAWVPEPMVKLALRSLDKNDDVEIIIINSDEVDSKALYVVDLEALFLAEINKSK